MITKVTNYPVQKCWKAESNLSNISFDQINIIFGHNGAGKSSLAGIIVNDYTVNSGAGALRLFNSEYVTGKLLLEDKSGIRGVVSNFGEKDVNIEKRISTNNQKIEGIRVEAKKEADTQKRLTNDSEKLIKDIVKRRKDKNTKIHNKSENKTTQEKVMLWVKDYEDAYKQFPNEDYNAITGNADFSAESEQLNLLILPDTPALKGSMLSDLATILKGEYKNVDVPEHEVVSWLQDGIHIHADRRYCEFCGSSIDIGLIQKRVNTYLNDKKHKATLELNNYRIDLNELRELGQKLIDSKDSLVQTLGLSDEDVKFDEVSNAVTQIAAVINETLDVKTGKMEHSLTLDEAALSKAIQSISEAIDALESAKKQNAQNLLDKINRLETLVKGAIGLEISNTDTITDNLGKIAECTKKLQGYSDDQKQLLAENERLRREKSDLADFANYLNSVLTDLNLNFSLVPSGRVYVLRHTDGSALKLEDISDGERNLLSLIHFYYEMLDDDSGSFKDSLELVVIDDPISSLDDGNKFFISELVKSILNQSSIQVFVMSHSWDDFCNLAYGRNKEGTSLFEIKKELNVSNMYAISNGKLLKPYIMLYREVNNFRQLSVGDISDEAALHMPNTMRRVLEEYVKFRVNVDFATEGHADDVAKAVFGEELLKLSNTKKQKLNQLLAVCNILSHKASHPKNPTEIHESAKFLIMSIEQNDKYHHFKMIGDM